MTGQKTFISDILSIGLLLSLIVGCLLLTIDPHTLPVNTVQIKGELTNTNLLILQDTISQATVNGFLRTDPTLLNSVLLALPWIETTQVQKIWPDTIIITINEYQPIAKWENKLIDIKGNIISLKNTRYDRDLPRFMMSIKHLDEIIYYYMKFVPIIRKAKLDIHEFGYDTFRAWYILLDNGTKLWLGNTNIETRLKRFFKIYPDKSLGSNSHIDLRYNNGIAIY
ncbi:MAG TPA: FtsQ-type POTRA domain-containing protein [Thioploca sp.]|nr:FtsQ-type POTRA domain-containing protein [Thioploca sp.]